MCSDCDADDGFMIPLIDLLNHDHDSCHVVVQAIKAESTQNSEQKQKSGVEVVVESPCSPGGQILYSYGAKGNLALLRAYGFCQFENPHETVRVTMPQSLQPNSSSSSDTQSASFEISHLDPIPEALFEAAQDACKDSPGTGPGGRLSFVAGPPR